MERGPADIRVAYSPFSEWDDCRCSRPFDDSPVPERHGPSAKGRAVLGQAEGASSEEADELVVATKCSPSRVSGERRFESSSR